MTDQNYDTLNKNIKYLQDKYGNNFDFINFGLNTANIDSSGVGCYPTSEYSTSSYKMDLLDRNLHSFESCKLNATLQNKKYFAVAKSSDRNDSRSDGYKCYVSDTVQNTPVNDNGNNVIVLFQMENISNLSFDMAGNLSAMMNGQNTSKITLFESKNAKCAGGSLFSYLGIKSGKEGFQEGRRNRSARVAPSQRPPPPPPRRSNRAVNITPRTNPSYRRHVPPIVAQQTRQATPQEIALANAAKSPYSVQKLDDYASMFTLTNNIKDQFNCDNTTNRCTGTVQYKCGSQLNYKVLNSKPPGYSIRMDCNGQKRDCNYMLRLLDDGDVQVFKSNRRIWSLFKTYGEIRTVLAKYKNRISSNTEWQNENLTNSKLNELQPGNDIPNAGKPYLISKNAKFKLEIHNGKLLLKCNTVSCLSKRNIKYTTEDENNMSFYPYKVTPNPLFNNTYYASNTPGYYTLQKIEENSPSLQKTDEYIEYPNSYLSDQKIDPSKVSWVSPQECKKKCDSDSTCKSYATMEIEGNENTNTYNVCYTDTSIPIFSDIYTRNPRGPQDINSNLYIRKNKINIPMNLNPHTLTLNPTQINSEIRTINDSIFDSGYTAYTVLSTPFNQDQIVGYQGTDEYKQLVGNAPNTIYQNKESFMEGIDGTSSVSQSSSSVNTQINNLDTQSKNYNNLLTRTNTNYNSIKTNVNSYNDTLNNIENNTKSYYSSQYGAYMPDENDISNQIVEDSKRLAVEQNNLWIAGSIAATTVFLTGIILNL